MAKSDYPLKNFYLWLSFERKAHPDIKSKSSMIGYMEEYLLIKHGVSVGNCSNIYERLHNGERFGNIRYDQLTQEIMSAEKRKRFMEDK